MKSKSNKKIFESLGSALESISLETIAPKKKELKSEKLINILSEIKSKEERPIDEVFPKELKMSSKKEKSSSKKTQKSLNKKPLKIKNWNFPV